MNQAIVVAANDAPTIDSSTNQDAVAMSSGDLHNTPIFDQDVITTLTPFLDSASGSSGGVTLIVDGVEMKSAGVSASAIQEVRTNNDPYSAEFTRPGRGRIEIITKPGTPEFHGEANFTGRNAVFNAKNYFASVRPPESREIYEGHLRGPAGHGGHTNFITSSSYRVRDTAVAVNANGPQGLIQENVLAPSRNLEAMVRITHDFPTRHRLSVGYNVDLGKTDNAGVGGIVLPEAGSLWPGSRQGRDDQVDSLIV